MFTQNLVIGYPKKIVASNLDLRLEKGKLTALLGINGAGKSTLLRTLAGVQKPLAGKVILDKQDLHQLSPKALARRLSLVLTEKSASMRFTVQELISLGRYPHTNWRGILDKDDQKIIDWAMEAVGMTTYKDSPLSELSDGLLQKTMIARALVQEGDILLLDEPTAHLDLLNRSEILILLAQLATDFDKAILVSTHELELILQIAHQLWLFKEDTILTGLTEELVLNGDLAKAFVRPPLFFDEEKGTFRIQTISHQHTLSLVGDVVGKYWTKLALEKQGFAVTDTPTQPTVMIRKHNNTQWIWQFGKHNFEDLTSLINYLLSIREEE